MLIAFILFALISNFAEPLLPYSFIDTDVAWDNASTIFFLFVVLSGVIFNVALSEIVPEEPTCVSVSS